MHHNEHPGSGAGSHQDEPFLRLGVVRVIDQKSMLVVEHVFRLLERHPVLGGIGRRLARVPFEVEFRHLLLAIHHIALVCKKRLSALSVAP